VAADFSLAKYQEIIMTIPRSQTGSSTTKNSSAPNAIELLMSDHRKVEALFEEFEKSKRDEKRERIVQEICKELTLHADLEESEFYPLVQKTLKDTADMIDEARVEHSSLRWLIKQLQSADSSSDLYEAKVTVLKEYVQHHVREEEKELFPKVKKSEIDIEELGVTLQNAKPKLEKTLKQKLN
jgi:hemerythrin superfamily protein